MLNQPQERSALPRYIQSGYSRLIRVRVRIGSKYVGNRYGEVQLLRGARNRRVNVPRNVEIWREFLLCCIFEISKYPNHYRIRASRRNYKARRKLRELWLVLAEWKRVYDLLGFRCRIS